MEHGKPATNGDDRGAWTNFIHRLVLAAFLTGILVFEVSDAKKYDVVLTTYGILTAEHGKDVGPSFLAYRCSS